MNELTELSSILTMANGIGVTGLLIAIVWYQKKDREEIKKERLAEIKTMRDEHIAAMEAQRIAHKHSLEFEREEKQKLVAEFFSSLKDVLKELSNDLKIGNEVRTKMFEHLNLVREFQNEAKRNMSQFELDLNAIKHTLLHNSMILSKIVGKDLGTKELHDRCELPDKPIGHYRD